MPNVGGHGYPRRSGSLLNDRGLVGIEPDRDDPRQTLGDNDFNLNDVTGQLRIVTVGVIELRGFLVSHIPHIC